MKIEDDLPQERDDTYLDKATAILAASEAF